MQPVKNPPGTDQSNSVGQTQPNAQPFHLDSTQGDLLAQVVQALATPTLNALGQAQGVSQPVTHFNQTNKIFMTPVSGVSFVQNSGSHQASSGLPGRQKSPVLPQREPLANANYPHYRNMARAAFGADFDVAINSAEALFNEQLIPTPPPEAQQAGFAALDEFQGASWQHVSPSANANQANQSANPRKRKADPFAATVTVIQGGKLMKSMALPPSLPSGIVDRSGRVVQFASSQTDQLPPALGRVRRNLWAAMPPAPRFPGLIPRQQPSPLALPPSVFTVSQAQNQDTKPAGRPKQD
jgi:hypothetical protein